MLKVTMKCRAADIYHQYSEYGFMIEKNRREWKQLQIPELNSGFLPAYWYAGKDITEIAEDRNGCYVKKNEDGRIPFTYVVHVPVEGNYKVTIQLYPENDVEEVAIFLGRRRLSYLGKLKKGQSWRGSFITNVCPIIPRNFSTAMQDTTIDITIIGSGVHMQEVDIEQVQCPTIYIAGDSTVTDQSADYPYYPYHSYAGWGQMLPFYCGTSAAVSNHSHSGLSTESFRSEGHYKLMYDRIKVGDVCLIQFGHNDQKVMHLNAEGGYRENLLRLIDEIKDKGALPVVITPLARNTWKGNDNTYNDLLEGYSKECIKVANECGVPLVNLHQKSKDLVIHLGRENVKKYFFPSDYTHSNDYGAFLFAGYVFEEMCQYIELRNIVEHGRISEQIQNVCQTQWLPPEVFPEIVVPAELADVVDPNTEHLFEHLERPDEKLTRVEALELIITAMHFFPTNVYNNAFEDIVGHETYAGTVECAYQNGLIPECMVIDHRFYPDKFISGREYKMIAENGYRSRRGEVIPLNLISAIENKNYITRRTAADVCKQLHI